MKCFIYLLPMLLYVNGRKPQEIKSQKDYDASIRATINYCDDQGKQLSEYLYNRENQISNEIKCQRDSPSYMHYANMKTSKESLAQSKSSYSTLMATKYLQHEVTTKQGMSPNTFNEYLRNHVFKTQNDAFCRLASQIRCNPAEIYRRIDGSCNNLRFPTWAMANSPLTRLLPANYDDDVFAPRKSRFGNPLPNARRISRTLYEENNAENPSLTQIAVTFGQFLSHDGSLVASTRTNSGGIQCCTPDGSSTLPPQLLHHACFPIEIPRDDPFYSKFNQGCMNFVRSITISREDCTLGAAEQQTATTGTLDLSLVYGNSIEESRSLRSLQFGRLKTQPIGGREYPPPDTGHSCAMKQATSTCFLAGDPRVIETPHMAIIHTLFLREHNRIAGIFHQMKPQWDDEKLFQEARRLTIAIFQHLSYDSWLPLFLGQQFINQFISKPFRYNDKVQTGTLNEFTTSALRYLHSCVHGTPRLLSESRQPYGNFKLSDTFNDVSLVVENKDNFDSILRGSATNLMMELDNGFTKELTDHLFAVKDFGFDMESIDIQRGRDHGLQPYVKYRAYCGLPRIRTFDDLKGIMSDERISKLKQLYESVEDIDLFVGSVAENHLSDGSFGETIQCIFGEQFYRWKFGDRFYWENLESPHPFTPAQQAEIRKVTFSRVICDNGDNIKSMQPLAFKKIDNSNPLLPCNGPQIPAIDFTKFQ